MQKFIVDFQTGSESLPAFWTEEARARWIAWVQRISDRLNPFRNGYFSQELAQADFEPDLDCRRTDYLGFESR